MSPILDPDDYIRGEFRRIADSILEAIDDAIDTPGLNTVERGDLIWLRVTAMHRLHYREIVPTYVPNDWHNSHRLASAKAILANRAEEKVRAANWRAMSQEERDALFLRVLADGPKVSSKMWETLNRAHGDDLTFPIDKVRAWLKSLRDRGLVDSTMVPSKRGRPAACWSITDAGRSQLTMAHEEVS